MIGTKRINLKHLRAFQAVAHHGRFTRAAEAIGLSQPALSALVAQLEEDLGVKLVHRTTRAMDITPIGREFLGACERILVDVDGAIGEARDYAHLRRGKLRLAALPSVSRILLPAALRSFRDLHPQVMISVVDVLGDALLDQLLTGQVDLGIGYAEASDELRAEPLLTDQLTAVGTSDLLGRSMRQIRWAELAEYDILAMSHGSTVRRLMDDGARETDVSLRVVLESHQMPTAIAYARAGLGIAVLPSTALSSGEEASVRGVPIVAPVIKRKLSLLSRRSQALSPAAEAFATLLRENLGRTSSS
ncbi:MAG: LysR family transcriptional regulator [Gammaproteobacteria bacterium]|nr:LysR family transcriptional regulator [Gammaproteobacteria bacterium]MBU2408783.1 LysR family transcriptional regulator [Gammaproteobacteria bacterium]